MNPLIDGTSFSSGQKNSTPNTNNLLSTILRHDRKQTSYKIALVRAINDVVLAFPDLKSSEMPIAVPLRILAGFWVAYYWPFVDPKGGILQGQTGISKSDLSFRAALTTLRAQWELLLLTDKLTGGASDGFVLSGEMRLPHKRLKFPEGLVVAYDTAIKEICDALQQPIQYAGPGQWEVFEKPKLFKHLNQATLPIPGTRPEDRCLVISTSLWTAVSELSLWIEALCIHEWCLFTERLNAKQKGVSAPKNRGDIFKLLTAHRENRRQLSWERNQIQLLLLEGHQFTCPWSHKLINTPSAKYDLDHIIPITIYPINELWNLVPSDPKVNIQKGGRVPSEIKMEQAMPHLITTYSAYLQSPSLHPILVGDVDSRFSQTKTPATSAKVEIDGEKVALNTRMFARHVRESRNLEVF